MSQRCHRVSVTWFTGNGSGIGWTNRKQISQSEDLSLKLLSLMLVSWLMFMLESDTKGDLVVLSDDILDLDLDRLGLDSGSGPWSAKYGCDRASWAVILFLGSKCNIF